MALVTIERLKYVLDYDPETGVFRWKIKPRQRACSGIAGTVTNGYRHIGIGQHVHRAHRLAWFYVNGVWPSGDLDHVNGKRDDNRIANLRLANKQTNQANAKRKVTNMTGFKGVFVISGKRHKKFSARITVDYQTIWLGNFYSAEEAHEAYCQAAKKHFGEFARAS